MSHSNESSNSMQFTVDVPFAKIDVIQQYLFIFSKWVTRNNKGRQIIKYSINVGGREMVLGGTKRRAIFIVTHLSPFCIIQT